MTYRLLCHPPICYMKLPKLLDLLAEMEAIEDKDFNVNNAIAEITHRLEQLRGV